jgi:hypothetical protein
LQALVSPALAFAFAFGLAKYQEPKACFSHTRKRELSFNWFKELF